MNFLKPAYLYLLFLILLLLLLYVLRLRRKTYVISSCLLWERAIEDMKANTLFQRLRRNLLLPLQIIFLTLAILALARPFLHKESALTWNTILIIDGSASMKATDVGKTRFEAAKSVAAEIVENLGNGGRMMIIRAGSAPRVVVGFTSDRLQLQEAIKKMQPADTLTDLASAIQLASSMAKDTKKSQIILLSDGQALESPRTRGSEPSAPEELSYTAERMRFIRFGNKDASNIAITALEVAQSNAEPSKRQAFVALQNFGRTRKQNILLELYQNENLIDVQELNLSPGERRSVVFDGVEYVDSTLKVAIDVNDYLDVDNHAYYVMKEPEPSRILLVSTGNLFLEEAIRTASTSIKIQKKAPDTYSDYEKYDVVVLDGFVPNQLPSKNVILVNSQVNLPFGKLLSQIDNPTVIDWNRTHPVMRFVDLSNLRLGRLFNYEMPPWMKPLVESDIGALAWSGEHDGQRIIVLPFDIQPRPSNNFSVLVAFPIFISNALDWLTEKNAPRQVKPGDPLRLSIPATLVDQPVKVRKPDGEELDYRPKDSVVAFSDTDVVGIYEISGQGFAEKFAVNLLDESESDIMPAEKIEFAGQDIVSSDISEVSNEEIWTGLVLVALILLAVEWWVYHRRVLV